MHNKLTLRLEESLIEQAKAYAKENNKSLSQIVADYFQILTKETESQKLPPVTKSLIGAAKGVDNADYKKHLEDKYL